MQLTALQSEYARLRDAGVEVVAITAEPGAVSSRLLERQVPPLDFPIRSDPEHTFLRDIPNMPSSIFVLQHHEWDVSGPYTMIQPALVVFDGQGQYLPECSWSWKTMGLLKDGNWDTRVDTEAWSGPIKQVMLVTMRPVMSDLLASIQERRRVKLGSTHDGW